jgi:hypothetical protein
MENSVHVYQQPSVSAAPLALPNRHHPPNQERRTPTPNQNRLQHRSCPHRNILNSVIDHIGIPMFPSGTLASCCVKMSESSKHKTEYLGRAQ